MTMKRAASDSEDDVFDDKLGSPGLHGTDRKKRRGVIEKRRRDRINNSLSELRRLVPTAFEKQGSAKLEKAEILQMTVDHLKMLHSKGIGGYNFDAAALAMDYRVMGFRECAQEVARYLVSCEGMDIQDPLRLRLMSHIQSFSSQREAHARAQISMSNSHWPSSGFNGSSQYNMNSSGTGGSTGAMHGSHDVTGIGSHVGGSSLSGSMAALAPAEQKYAQHLSATPHYDNNASMRLASSVASNTTQLPTVTSSPASMTSPHLSALSSATLGSQMGQFSLGVNSLSPANTHTAGYNPSASSIATFSGLKPHRPWGAEMAF